MSRRERPSRTRETAPQRSIAGPLGVAFGILGMGLAAFAWLAPALDLDVEAFTGREFVPAIDSVARNELLDLSLRIENLEADLRAMREGAANSANIESSIDTGFAPEEPEESQAPQLNYADVVLLAGRRQVNEGLQLANPSFLVGFLGMPRQNLTDDCLPMTNPALVDLLETDTVGPIRVTMLRPAILSMKTVFQNVRVYDQDLHDRINTAGSLCVRHVRGAPGSVSNHAFGLAVDINIDGVLDGFGDGRTQVGLQVLAEFFKAEGWVWGAGFSREDSMHFEVGREKLEAWRRLGQI